MNGARGDRADIEFRAEEFVTEGRGGGLGRTILLRQDKRDMGVHRFTQGDAHLLVVATGRWRGRLEESGETHKALAVYKLESLYMDRIVADEDLRFVVAD